MKITDKRTRTSKTFGDIDEGTIFMQSGFLYMKIEHIYLTEDIIREVDCVHDIDASGQIDSTIYNAIRIDSGEFRLFYDYAEIELPSVEIILTN